MILVDQKIVDPNKTGDCFYACIATVLQIPYDEKLDELFNSIEMETGSGSCFGEAESYTHAGGCWMSAVSGFAFACGYRFKMDTCPDGVPLDVHTIAGGPSPRNCKRGHAVVVRGTGPTVFHDPHPSRDGLSGPIEEWYWFEKI